MSHNQTILNKNTEDQLTVKIVCQADECVDQWYLCIYAVAGPSAKQWPKNKEKEREKCDNYLNHTASSNCVVNDHLNPSGNNFFLKMLSEYSFEYWRFLAADFILVFGLWWWFKRQSSCNLNQVWSTHLKLMSKGD